MRASAWPHFGIPVIGRLFRDIEGGHLIPISKQQAAAGDGWIVPGLTLNRLETRNLGKLIGRRTHQDQLAGISRNDQVISGNPASTGA